MEVSWNGGTPKSSMSSSDFSILNHPFWGSPIYGNLHIGETKRTVASTVASTEVSPIGTPGFRWSPGFLKSPVDFLGHNLCHTCEDCATICGHSVAVRALEPLPAALRKTGSCSQLCMRQHSFGHWLIGLSNLAFCVRTSDIFILVAEPSSNCCLRYGRKHCPGKFLSGVWWPEGQLHPEIWQRHSQLQGMEKASDAVWLSHGHAG